LRNLQNSPLLNISRNINRNNATDHTANSTEKDPYIQQADRGDAGSAHRKDLNKNTMPTDPERPADAEWVNRTMSYELQR
jgi:hypothetical protein